MFGLMRLELRKVAAQRRSWAGFLAVAVMNALFAFAFVMRQRHAATRPVRGMQERLVGEFINANVYTQTILAPCMFMLFPMILAILGAHMLAGEIETGSIRLVLCRAVSRGEVLLAKFAALCAYSALMLFALLLTSWAVSSVLFEPGGDVVVFGPMFMLPRGVVVHPAADAVHRILLSYMLALPMLMSVCAMALMMAALTRHFTSAAILTGTVYFCSYVVMGIPLLSTIHPFMPTRYLPFWRWVLQPEIPWGTIGMHAAWTACYTAAFLAVAGSLFSLRDL